MNRFARLICMALLAAAVLASTAHGQTSTHTPSASDPALAVSRSAPEPSEAAVIPPAPEQSNSQLRSRSAPAVLPTATVLRLKLSHPISTASAKPGEQFIATLSSPVQVNGRTIFPAGTSVSCRIDRARGARRFVGKPLLSIKAIRAHTPSGEELNFIASVVDTSNPQHLDVSQEGSVRGISPNPMNKIEMGALTGVGAVAGTVIAGPEGLLVGTAGGALIAAGHIFVKHRELTLPAGTELIFELDAPSSSARPRNSGKR